MQIISKNTTFHKRHDETLGALHFCIGILDMMSLRLVKASSIDNVIEFDQYVEDIDLAKSIVGGVLRNKILKAFHILASILELKDIFSLGGSKNET